MSWKFWERRSVENPATPITALELAKLFGGDPTPAGVSISEQNSVQIAAVYACVKVIAETIASLPLHVFRETEDGRERARGDPRDALLSKSPSPMQTSFCWRELMMAHTLLWGNHYSNIIFNASGRPVEIVPLMPWAVFPRRLENREIVYRALLQNGEFEDIPAREIIHIPGLGFDGVKGMSPIQTVKNALGVAKAAEEFGSRFFGNDARPGVVVEIPGDPGPEAIERLRAQIKEKHGGLGKSHNFMIAPGGMKLHEVGVPPEDAQFLETRKFQVSEIARIYRCPPHMIGDLDKATFSNIENQDIGFAKHTIRPCAVRIEQELDRKLLGKGFHAEFNLDGLQRGDFKTRMEGYGIGIQNGFMAVNEVRRLENLPPVEGGDELFRPLNMGEIDGSESDPDED